MTCIGCGYCCLKAKCIAGARLYGVSDNTCEALVFDEKDQRHKCKLVMFGNSLSDHYKNELHIGEGCCSSMNTWRKEPIQNRIPKIYVTPQQTPLHPTLKILLECIGSDFTSTSERKVLMLMKFKHQLLHTGMDDLVVDDIIGQSVEILAKNKPVHTF